MKENGIKYFEAPFEAKQQRGKFEESGYIEATISSDGDMIMLGAKEILGRTNMKRLEFCVFQFKVCMICFNVCLARYTMYVHESKKYNFQKM